ncbi:MAG: tetratricopeptide repeat protein [Stigonema ocellatum SAG 48.90 = DSM 106950]|nr:tetratricopeptide repeat protein [Stigonema ocellatum SAG 48.90 = DSM 106950]
MGKGFNRFWSKKKVRGWKRRIRQIQQWKQRNFNVGINDFNYDHAKIQSVKASPPMWYRRLIEDAMLEIYHNWKKQLIERGEPFYLRIWLFHPRFYKSQVVAGIRDRIDWYENVFDLPENQDQSFPYQEYSSNRYNLHDVTWELRIDDVVHLEKFYELTPQEVEVLQKTAYSITQTSDGDTLYAVRVGSVWLGSYQIAPNDDDALYNKGNALIDKERYPEAIAAYDKALELKPDRVSAWFNKGFALYYLKRYPEALAAYDKALEFQPNDDNLWYNKACCYALQGNVDLALENLRVAINLNIECIETAKNDSDFEIIRANESFRGLIADNNKQVASRVGKCT